MDLFKQFPESSLPFDEEFQSLFQLIDEKAISSVDLVSSTPLQLAKLSGRSLVITKKFQTLLENEVMQTIKISSVKPETLDDEIFKSFTSGDDIIDDIIDGGINLGRLTEVVGASATGKSHFLLQLLITVQLPREFGGLGYQITSETEQISMTQTSSIDKKYQVAKVVYISTESGIETRRLQQICDHYCEIMKTNGINSKYWPKFDNIYQITCNDLETQDHILFYQLPNLVRQQPIKLIIIDSIAHHLRLELNTRDQEVLKKTWAHIYKMTNFLKKMANDNELSVVVSNQVSDRPMNKIHGNDPLLCLDYQLGWLSGWDNETILRRQMFNDNEEYDKLSFMDKLQLEKSQMTNNYNYKQIPSLGVIWQNKVDDRIVLSKYEQPIWDELLQTIRVNNENRPEEEEEEYYDISKNFELKRRFYYNEKITNFQIWKGGIRSEK